MKRTDCLFRVSTATVGCYEAGAGLLCSLPHVRQTNEPHQSRHVTGYTKRLYIWWLYKPYMAITGSTRHDIIHNAR